MLQKAKHKEQSLRDEFLYSFLYYFLFSFFPCIIALDNGGSKVPIRLSGRGRSCLAQLLNLGCLG